MEWAKLKNIMILILLLANLFLLGIVIVQERDAALYQEQALNHALGVLEKNGIHVERDRLPEEMNLSVLTVSRDLESEKALAEALLGPCAASDLGGGRYAYESELGTAEFRSNGNFSVSFSNGLMPIRRIGGEEALASALLKEAGLAAVLNTRVEDGERVVLTYHQTWQNASIGSCEIAMEYRNGSLRSMSGLRLMGTPQSANDKSVMISLSTALVRILNGVNDLGDICNEITAMEPGYLLTSSTEGTRLVPVWYVTTDTGAYNLNALTGALERA